MPSIGASHVSDYDTKNTVDFTVIKEIADWIKSIPKINK